MVALNGFESLAQAGRELHTTALQWKGKHTCIHTSRSIVLPPCEPLLPPVTHSGLGLQPMKEGWVLGGSALLLPGVDWLWSWLSDSGSCQELQREMDEQLWWLLGIGWWCVSSDWWVNTAPPAPRVKLVRPCHKTSILSWGSYMLRRKGKEIRRFVNWADVGKWLCGRADSIIESCSAAVETTGRFHSRSIIKTEGLLMHWWGFKCLWRALSLCGFLFVLPGFSHCSQLGGPQNSRLSHWKQLISELFWLINLSLV